MENNYGQRSSTVIEVPLVYFITHLYPELGQYLSPSDSPLAYCKCNIFKRIKSSNESSTRNQV